MPTNRTRRTRARQELDSLKMGELWYGPGTCLLAGGGYSRGEDWEREISLADRCRIIEQMEDDWHRHRAEVLAAWDGRNDEQLYIARRIHRDPKRPWAERFDKSNKEKRA